MKELRARAEEMLKSSPDEFHSLPVDDIKHLIHELQVHQIELEMQNDELFTTQKDLEISQQGYSDLYEKFRNLYNYAPVGYCTLDTKGYIQNINFTAADQLGVYKDKLMGKRIFHSIDEPDRDIFFLHLRKAFETKKRQICELKITKKDGPPFIARMESIVVMVKNRKDMECRTTITDISEKRQESERRELIVKILNMLNRSYEDTDSINDILLVLKKFTGLEAVGIRLKEGEDFPYYVTEGFPPRFVEAEKFLCARSQAGEIIRDSQQNPYLECMCGNVLCKRTDPALPFFTEYGSFWTNSTTALLASTTEADRQARTRNHCHGEGYESVALIPIRIEDEIIGLIQFNDRRKGMFTPEMIRFFEDIGISTGFAIMRRQSREQLTKALDQKEVLMRELYHRTKNNMQVICNMLTLQSNEVENHLLTNAFKKIENRIHSMSLVHEKLYCAKDLSKIDLAVYIKALVPLLTRSYDISTRRISFNIDAKEIFIPIDSGIPCGMILNELITNAIKHGFPDEKKGEVNISLSRTETGEIKLVVSDNGVGVPEGFDFKKCKSLGHKIIFNIGERQLGGKIIYDTGSSGVSCQIIFKSDLYGG